MRPSPRETSWDAWPTGPLRARTEIVVDGHSTTETSEVSCAILYSSFFPSQEANTFLYYLWWTLGLLEFPIQTNKSTAPATPSPSTHLPPRTSPPSPSLATYEIRQSQDTVAAPSSPVAVASVEVRPVPEVDEPHSRGAVPTLVADRATTEAAATTLAVEVVASAGRTMTSLPATVMLASTSRPSGSCSRRSTSTAWLS